MPRVHFLQPWFGLSDPSMEEALHDVLLYYEIAGPVAGSTCLPDETAILRFRPLPETHDLAPQVLATVNAQLIEHGVMLKTDTAVDATLLAPLSSAKSTKSERDPEMHQTNKFNMWHFGVKAHIGADGDAGLVHTEIAATNVHDVIQAQGLQHGAERVAIGDAAYQGEAKRAERTSDTELITAMRPGLRRAIDKTLLVDALLDQLERLTASIRAKVEHSFRVIQRQFGHVKVRLRGVAKNTARLMTLFALPNLWMGAASDVGGGRIGTPTGREMALF